ncbi:MAG: DMT family transporter [Ideonella sp.]|nr:DMT family transporter [Ideonella sp.]
MSSPARLPLPAVGALLVNAMVWGLAWWPMRQLEAAGLHPLMATAAIFTLAVGVLTLWRPTAWREVLTHPSLWVILLAAGTTNAAFNWGVTQGDVVRVVLLFYLMPLWAVLLARLLLHERITPMAMARVALALGGALMVLWPRQGGFSLTLSPTDLLGLLGGLSFALNNIMLRRESARSEAARGLAMFAGGAIVSGVLALSLQHAHLPPPSPAWMAWVLGLVGVMLAGNLALQYGASRLPAQATSIIMLTEILWATGSALALGAGHMDMQLALGGALIIASAALAALRP